MALTAEQAAWVREGFTPEKPPPGQTLDQFIVTEASSARYAYMLDFGLPALDEEATRTLMREMCIEAGISG